MKQFIYILSACFGLLLTRHAKGQTAAADNKMAEIIYNGSAKGQTESITFEIPKGLAVYGVFEGRTPCIEISRQLKSAIPPGCDHLKWRIIFFRDKATLKPATCILVSDMSGFQPLKGKWNIIKGTDPAAVVYMLDYGQSGKSIYLLKGDENILFFLDENLELRTGNRDFSYTLNRIQLVRHLSNR